MKTLTKSFWKNFFLMGGSFSVLMLITDLIQGNKQSVVIIIGFILNFILFGFLMSGFFWFIQKNRIKKLNKMGIENPDYYSLNVRPNRKLISGISQDELLNRLHLDNEIKKRKIIVQGNSIKFKTKMSFKSWGEDIKIMVSKTIDGKNLFDIYSKPILVTTLYDYGINLDNVLRIEEIIEKGG